MEKNYVYLPTSQSSLDYKEEHASDHCACNREGSGGHIRGNYTVLILSILSALLGLVAVAEGIALTYSFLTGTLWNRAVSIPYALRSISKTPFAPKCQLIFKIVVGLSIQRTAPRTMYLPTVYMSENRTEADIALDSINTGHGVVLVDKHWAVEHNIVDSIPHPRNSKRLIYIIEVYHAMHCIVG